jgi:hypothetical protein
LQNFIKEKTRGKKIRCRSRSSYKPQGFGEHHASQASENQIDPPKPMEKEMSIDV